jgi:hypothetical protein
VIVRESDDGDGIAERSVRTQLSWGLKDLDIQQTIASVDELDGTLEKEVLANEDAILEQLAPLRDAWREADASLAEANERLAQAGVSETNIDILEMVTSLAIMFTLAVSIGCAFLFDSHFLYGVLLAGAMMLPLGNRREYRASLSRNLSMSSRKAARKEARERFEFAAKNLATVAIREAINRRLTSFSTEFRILDDRGLRTLADPEREVSTAASEELSNLMASLSSGSIGLSGPRGVGKTTLIDSFARGRSVLYERARIGLVVSAPVKYDAREFVLHLFASLCERVLGQKTTSLPRSSEQTSAPKRRYRRLARFLEGATAILALAGGAMLLFDRITPQGPRETAYFLFAIAVVTFCVSLGISLYLDTSVRETVDRWRLRLSGNDRPTSPEKGLESTAQEQLEQIRFQQSTTSSWSGSIELPLGIAIGNESSTTVARTPWSLPETVEAFRQYARSLTEDHYLVIGIDELDKMGSDDSAREFLNNIKGVFGVHGCYYLVSVSDDAMASFERRGLPVRDVFDSSFDAVQRIDYLTLSESRAVLESRVIGLPVPYQCLCHCMAGGLPRDLIRVTRELVHQANRGGATRLGDLCHAVVDAELHAKMAGAIELSREVSGRGGEWLQKWLHDQSDAVANVDGLQGTATLLAAWGGPKENGASTSVGKLAFEVAAFNYYAATLLELFTDDQRFVEFLRAGPESAEISREASAVLETLATARQQFAVGPGLAWDSISTARRGRALAEWDDPRGPRASVPG